MFYILLFIYKNIYIYTIIFIKNMTTFLKKYEDIYNTDKNSDYKFYGTLWVDINNYDYVVYIRLIVYKDNHIEYDCSKYFIINKITKSIRHYLGYIHNDKSIKMHKYYLLNIIDDLDEIHKISNNYYFINNN